MGRIENFGSEFIGDLSREICRSRRQKPGKVGKMFSHGVFDRNEIPFYLEKPAESVIDLPPVRREGPQQVYRLKSPLLQHGKGNLYPDQDSPFMGISDYAFSMGYPAGTVYAPHQEKLDDILLVPRQPVEVFLYIGKTAWVIGIQQLFGKFGGMEGMEVKSLLLETRFGLQDEGVGKRPGTVLRRDCPQRMIKPVAELLLQKPV
jgi:hypothetical protein